MILLKYDALNSWNVPLSSILKQMRCHGNENYVRTNSSRTRSSLPNGNAGICWDCFVYDSLIGQYKGVCSDARTLLQSYVTLWSKFCLFHARHLRRRKEAEDRGLKFLVFLVLYVSDKFIILLETTSKHEC
jgi:hypothetical protein